MGCRIAGNFSADPSYSPASEIGCVFEAVLLIWGTVLRNNLAGAVEIMATDAVFMGRV